MYIYVFDIYLSDSVCIAGMHCLGAVTGGTSSPNGIGGRSGIFNVFRALGVLVCEGRIQGPPRGYKEGPHCAPPMQAVPNDHVCEEDNYLVNNIWYFFHCVILFFFCISQTPSTFRIFNSSEIISCKENGRY